MLMFQRMRKSFNSFHGGGLNLHAVLCDGSFDNAKARVLAIFFNYSRRINLNDMQ